MVSRETRHNLIIHSAVDAAVRLVHDDRKEDEELPRGSVEDALAAGEITVNEIVEAFRTAVVEAAGWMDE